MKGKLMKKIRMALAVVLGLPSTFMLVASFKLSPDWRDVWVRSLLEEINKLNTEAEAEDAFEQGLREEFAARAAENIDWTQIQCYVHGNELNSSCPVCAQIEWNRSKQKGKHNG